MRSHEEQKESAEESLECSSKSTRMKYETQHGVRYSELMRLEYFDCVTFTVVDPMHNLFQGTAKMMMKNIWPEKHGLKFEHLEDIQNIIDATEGPREIGRIPHKMASNYSSFTSDQWKNWTLYFSVFAIKPFLPKEAYICWLNFVEACRYFCKPIISRRDVAAGHQKMMEFCRSFERLYGSERVTPNMHLHTHLVECFLDYGPPYSFWLFSFERLNGILGSFHSNKRSVEVQVMRKILEMQNVVNIPTPKIDPAGKMKPLMDLFAGPNKTHVDNAGETARPNEVFQIVTLGQCPVLRDHTKYTDSCINPLGPRKHGCLTTVERNHLVAALSAYLGPVDASRITGLYNRYSAVEVAGERYGSLENRFSHTSNILASWCGDNGDIDATGLHIRPGCVLYYLQMHVTLGSDSHGLKPVCLAKVQWYQRHLSRDFFKSQHATVWVKNLFELEGPASFIPVQRIHGRCLSGFVKIDREPVRVIVPIVSHIYW